MDNDYFFNTFLIFKGRKMLKKKNINFQHCHKKRYGKECKKKSLLLLLLN